MCAEEVVTERPMPGFDQAAIDGYAVRSVDVAGVGDTGGVQVFADHGDLDGRDVLTLPVMGTIEAGARTLSRLQPRQAVRVQTGAPLPTLADAVLPLRWTDGGMSRVRVPTENLVSPDLVRRLCWEWEDISQSSPDPIAAVEAYLRTGQARAWQLELVVPILTAALTGAPDAGAQGDDGS